MAMIKINLVRLVGRGSVLRHGLRQVSTSARLCQGQPAEETKPDDLYRMVEVEVRGHDNAVLNSYTKFATTAAEHLDITVHKTWEPKADVYRKTLLRSIFVNKKCREQYEWWTYFRVMQFKYLTGSTASTFLEYIQRNLPEGVAMRVSKHRLERIPDHLVPPPEQVTSNTESKN